MNFLQIFRVSTYAMVLVGMLALVLAGFLHAAVLVLPVTAVFLAEHERTRARVTRLPLYAVNLLSLLALAAVVTFDLVLARDLVAAIIHFTVFLQIVKILTARGNRDHFQMLLLALAHLIMTTLVTVDTSFLIPFLSFLVLTPWVLTLYNLKAQAEAAHRQPATKGDATADGGPPLLHSRGLVGTPLFVSTALLSVVLLLHTLLIFFLFPRVSFGFLSRGRQYGGAVSGFSEQVDLSSFGSIKQSDAVALRVAAEDGAPIRTGSLFIRGKAFDHYDGAEWKRSMDRYTERRIDQSTGGVILRPGDFRRLPQYRIFLEPLDTLVLFTLDRTHAVHWSPVRMAALFAFTGGRAARTPFVWIDDYEAVYFSEPMAYERHYTVRADPHRAPDAALRAAGPLSPDEREALWRYLQLPPLSARFHQLAETSHARWDNDFDRLADVLHLLQSRCTYTLDLPPPTENPIEGFLFQHRSGHCEYFATAAALLLRAMDIPTRLVSGYRGGDWNRYGGYLTIRQRDAHTWIEVYFPNHGWFRFDPTPPDMAARDFRRLRYTFLRHMVEAIELRWFNYIVNYELSDQVRVAGNAYSGFRRFSDELRRALRNAFTPRTRAERAAAIAASPWPRALVLGVAITLGIVVVLWRVRQRGGSAAARMPPTYYRRYLAWAARRGWMPRRDETPDEFAARIGAECPQAGPAAAAVTAVYDAWRFGEVQPDPAALAAAEQALAQLRTLPRDLPLPVEHAE